MAAPRTTYRDAVRTFDHSALAASLAYGVLRQALSDLANETADLDPRLTLAGFLDAVRDMAATAVYGSMCRECGDACQAERHQHEPDEFPRPCGAYRLWWPCAAERKGERVRCAYRCGNSHAWTCSWLVDHARWVA
jgi:hypothetical protein